MPDRAEQAGSQKLAFRLPLSSKYASTGDVIFFTGLLTARAFSDPFRFRTCTEFRLASHSVICCVCKANVLEQGTKVNSLYCNICPQPVQILLEQLLLHHTKLSVFGMIMIHVMSFSVSANVASQSLQ